MDKEFVELTHDEKQAMRLVGLEPIDKFHDIWWEDCDAVTKKAAETLGFDEHKWDHDYAIRDLPVEEKYWKELSEEQRKAARYFGYNRSTWDEVEYDDDDLRSSYNDEMVNLVFLPGSTGQAWYAQHKCKVCERFHKRVTILIKKDGVST